MTYAPSWQPGQILKAADLDAGFTGVEADVSAAKALATAAETAAAGAVQQSQLGTTVATLVGGLIPSGQLPAGVSSFNTRTGVVSPVAADYLLASNISIPKPVLASFTYTLKSTLTPPTIAQVIDAGDCLVMSETCGVTGTGSSMAVARTLFGLFKPYNASVDSITIAIEADPFYPNLAGTTYNAWSTAMPVVSIMMLDLTSSTAGEAVIAVGVGRGAASDNTSTLYSGHVMLAPPTGGNPADYSGSPAILSGATANVSSVPTSSRFWLRVTGLTTTTCTSWISTDGRIWTSLGSWSPKIYNFKTCSHVGFAMAYAANPTASGVASNLVANVKVVGYQAADASGNALSV